MKKWICFFLILGLLCAPAAAAESAAVTYDGLEALVLAGNPQTKAVSQSYELLRLQQARQLSDHQKLMEGGLSLGELVLSAGPLQIAIKNTRQALEKETRDMGRVTGQQLFAARQLYLSHYLLAEQEAAVLRGRDAAQEALETCRKQYAAGLVSKNALEACQQTLDAAGDAARAARKAVEDNLSALANLLGSAVPVAPGGLPALDLASISARNYEKDLAAYTLAAPEVQLKKQLLDDAKKTLEAYSDSNTAANKYAYETALAAYRDAQTAAARDFPALYRNLQEDYQDYAGSHAVQDAKTALDRAQRQFDAGLISRNRLEESTRAWEDAAGAYRQQEILLSLSLVEYEYGLTLWTL